MNFIKLKDQFFFTDDDIREQEELLSIDNGTLRNFSINLNNPSIEKIYSVIPNYARKFFSISGIKISAPLIPHVDDVKTSLLFYIKTRGCKTQFYKVNKKNPTVHYSSTEVNGRQITNKNSYRPETYEVEDLIEDSFYIANDYDVYCVDGSKPHAVIPFNKLEPVNRTFILVKTDIPFASVVSLLEKTNSI
jgi:hypothetical protein